jgi:putative ABC transport system permease protein
VEQTITLDYAQQPAWLAFYAGLLLLIGLGSGFYPAFLLSSVRPVLALKGVTHTGVGNATLRNLLVVAQFAISGILIICTVVVVRQMNFIHTKDMGFVKDQVVIIGIRDPGLREKLTAFKEDLRAISGVSRVTSGSAMPNDISSSNGVNYPGKPEDVDFQVYVAEVDAEYIDLFELQLAEGRGFDLDQGDNSRTTIINEALARQLGWENPIGREMMTWSDTARIIGVLKDYNQHSLHLGIQPMQLYLDNSWHSDVAVRLASSDMEQAVLEMEKIYRKYSQKYPFEYTWFDDVVNKQYVNDRKTATMVNWSTMLTVLIACLGLYGLALHTTEQRLKEVGIRKILGASVAGLLLLLSRTFLGLVLIAFVIATPVAYWMMSGWLDNFAFHVPISPSVFILSLMAMLLVGGLTISYRTLRAARKNPVEMLKAE